MRDVYVRFAYFLFLFRIGLFTLCDIQYDCAVRCRLLIGTVVIDYKRYTRVMLLSLKNLAGVYKFTFLHKIDCKCRITNGYIIFLPNKH
jgi:hypothetical protein